MKNSRLLQALTAGLVGPVVRPLARCIASAVVGLAVAGTTVGGAAMLVAAPSAQAGMVVLPEDELILKDGRIIQGELIEETDTEVKFRIMVGSLSAVRTYQRSEVLAVTRGTEAKPDAAQNADDVKADTDASDGPSVYVMELTGEWGWEIAAQPIRAMLKDAEKHTPDIVVLVIDNVFADDLGNDLPDDELEPFNIFGVEEIEPIFTQEVPTEWGYTPRWVVWVKNSMGGIAMLPMNFEEIYFHPEGRIGGLGYLIFNWGTRGSAVTREKLISANLGHAEGMAIRGGYDPRIVRAMSDMRTVMSYKMVGGQAELLMRAPENPDEILLTDDGTNEEFTDTLQERVRGLGNDALTLKADSAQALGVSKGTVSTLDDLLWELGLSRNSNLLDSKSDRITERWADELTRARRRMPEIWEEYERIEVAGNYNERRGARMRQISKLEEFIRQIRRYEGLIFPQWFGLPTEPAVQVRIEEIKQQQIMDRR